MLKINLHPLAEEDLIDIWMYGCGEWGTSQADTYADSIKETLNALAQMPKKHPLRTNLHPPVRICHHISHLIIYTIEDDESAITVIRVLYKSMDIEQRL